MKEGSRKYLWDAMTAAERIGRFTSGRALDEYLSDELLRSAVERQFEIIGEALAALRRTDPDTASTIPEIDRIVAFRNLLIHGYATVDDRLVWGVVEGKLSGLREALSRLVGGLEGT